MVSSCISRWFRLSLVSNAQPVRIRGSLQGQRLDSRAMSEWAGSTCTRAKVVASAGLTPKYVQATVFNSARADDRSPFAIGTGMRFERQVLARDATLLRSLYEQNGRSDVSTGDLQTIMPATEREPDWDTYTNIAKDVLLRRLNGHHPRAGVLLQVPVAIRDIALVIPDMIVADGERGWKVGEIKSYLDRGGLTDGYKVAQAVRQAAVGVYALRGLAADNGVDPTLISDDVDIVMLRHGRETASLHSLQAAAEISAVLAAVDGIGYHLDLAAMAGVVSLDDPKALELISYHYESSCADRCALAETCGANQDSDKAWAESSGLGLALKAAGIEPKRAVELFNGSSPRDESESVIADTLKRGAAI